MYMRNSVKSGDALYEYRFICANALSLCYLFFMCFTCLPEGGIKMTSISFVKFMVFKEIFVTYSFSFLFIHLA